MIESLKREIWTEQDPVFGDVECHTLVWGDIRLDDHTTVRWNGGYYLVITDHPPQVGRVWEDDRFVACLESHTYLGIIIDAKDDQERAAARRCM